MKTVSKLALDHVWMVKLAKTLLPVLLICPPFVRALRLVALVGSKYTEKRGYFSCKSLPVKESFVSC